MAISFKLPTQLNATTPPERRGVRRDHVKMMVLDKVTGDIQHDQFFNLNNYLQPGDLIVLNSSRTVPAVLKARWFRHSREVMEDVEVRLAHRLNTSQWQALIVQQSVKKDDILYFSKSLTAKVSVTNPASPFVTLDFSKSGANLYDDIYSLGEPIRYEYIEEDWPLEYYQTVFSSKPGSVEMPSAGRAFSWEMIFNLNKLGVNIAFIELHTGLSYLLDDYWHQHPRENTEAFHIPDDTANAIKVAKRHNQRIIAVGTTVVRALETGFDNDGELCLQTGWTNLYVHQNYVLKVVNGLITGFHEPEASHLQLLSAFVSPEYLANGYQEALTHRYLWHEFGDINLII